MKLKYCAHFRVIVNYLNLERQIFPETKSRNYIHMEAAIQSCSVILLFLKLMIQFMY